MVVPMLVAMPCSTRVAVVFYVTIPHRCAVCGLGCLLQCDAVVGVGDTSRTRTTRHRQEREQAHVQARNVSTPVQMPTPHRPQTAHHSHRATIGDPPTRALHTHWVALLACVGGLTFIACVCVVGGFLVSFLLLSTCPTIASRCNNSRLFVTQKQP